MIARTDAIAVEGLDKAIERARKYYKAGADMIFVDAPESMKQIETIAKEFRGIPLLFNWSGPCSKTPFIDLETLRRFGYKLVIVSVATLFAAFKAIRELLEVMRIDGVPIRAVDKMVDFNEFIKFIGIPEVQELKKRRIPNLGCNNEVNLHKENISGG